MKILVFAHSQVNGGAEHALRYLVNLLRTRHEVCVVLPSFQGSEVLHYQSLGIQCLELPCHRFLPNYSTAVLHYAFSDLKPAIERLKGFGFDVAISNTISILHGGLIAQELSIPHLFYAHEFLSADDLSPTAITGTSYLALIEDLSQGVISCSKFVSEQFHEHKQAILSVLAPFDYSLSPQSRERYNPSECVVQVVGTQSIRKNVGFAVTLCKSLILRGLSVRLDVIGAENNGSQKLARTLHKRGVPHRLIPHLSNPFEFNSGEKVITLVCSTVEPYGLTIPESLRVGIPVLASKAGGPQEILPEDYLYSPMSLDEAVRKAEALFNEYDLHVARASLTYAALASQNPSEMLKVKLDALLDCMVANSIGRSDFILGRQISLVRQALPIPLDLDKIADHIAAISVQDGGVDDQASILSMISHEQQHPGVAVLNDIKKYDVVPFAMSAQMNSLYRHGIGLSIELASTFNEAGRLQMAAFIICALHNRQRIEAAPIRVLALGDGLGIDTIRLAQAGFHVDYMDYDQSNMSKIAALNFDALKHESLVTERIQVITKVSDKYDAVVCLEVIEHVDSPIEFSSAVADYLKTEGMLFISECFNGIENRWPTHLETNERYAGSLPWLMAQDFYQVDCNPALYGKPYVFAKRKPNQMVELQLDRATKIAFVNNQIDVGI